MTQQSLTIAQPVPNWIDDAFLWTATSLAVIAVSAAAPPPSVWLSSMDVPPAGPAATAIQRPTVDRPSVPPPLISFAEPAPGYPVVSPFGLRQLPWEEHGRLHQGVDIAAPSGTPVLAAADGVVVRTGVDAGYGRFIELRHADGLTSLYGRLNLIGARSGEAVKGGQAVGRIGSTGSSTGSHLHFEIHDKDQRPLNPALFLGRAFYSEADLPLRAALRAPRGVRVAYVSFIPAARRDQMAEREAERAAAEAEAAAARAPERLARADQAPVRLALPTRAQTPTPVQNQTLAAAPPISAASAPRPTIERVILAPVIADPGQGRTAGRVHSRIEQDGPF